MGIANRDKDSSEQVYQIDVCNNAVLATSATLFCAAIASPGQLLQTVITAWGLSAVPVYAVKIVRWTSAGITILSPGGGLTIAGAFGLSGGLIGETYAQNSSLASVQAGDALILASSGANTSSLGLVASFVLKATQDIKKTHSI